MKKGEQIAKMILLAANCHDGQYDLGGNPYILHPLKVMHYLKTEDEELQCIAVGHDLIEDTGHTAASLRHLGFSERIVAGIVALSKQKGESHHHYKIRVMGNADAVKVKMADLRHNSDIRRLKGITKNDIERIERYHKFYKELESL